MPQLVKGGKHVHGWSIVTDEGYIKISREALEEYGYKPNDTLILMPGSRGSEGFSVSTLEKLRSSPLMDRLNSLPSSLKEAREGETVTFEGKAFCWVSLDDDGVISVPLKTLRVYRVKTRDRILSIRGSHLGIGFPVKGPKIEEAKKHPELDYMKA